IWCVHHACPLPARRRVPPAGVHDTAQAYEKPEVSAMGGLNLAPDARVFLAQLEAVDLAGRRARKRFARFDPAREFPRAGFVLHVMLERLEQAVVCLVAVAQHDEGLRLDQAVRIYLADDGGLEHRFM